MEIKSHFDHLNINVSDLERSTEFYRRALGLEPGREIRHPEGKFVIRFMSRPEENFKLELTWLRDHQGAYELGENETHLCMRIEGDYEKTREFHREMGCICYENEQMGLYFIHDPDDYWIEILPVK